MYSYVTFVIIYIRKHNKTKKDRLPRLLRLDILLTVGACETDDAYPAQGQSPETVGHVHSPDNYETPADCTRDPSEDGQMKGGKRRTEGKEIETGGEEGRGRAGLFVLSARHSHLVGRARTLRRIRTLRPRRPLAPCSPRRWEKSREAVQARLHVASIIQ